VREVVVQLALGLPFRPCSASSARKASLHFSAARSRAPIGRLTVAKTKGAKWAFLAPHRSGRVFATARTGCGERPKSRPSTGKRTARISLPSRCGNVWYAACDEIQASGDCCRRGSGPR
jgi:hypothetical protein